MAEIAETKELQQPTGDEPRAPDRPTPSAPPAGEIERLTALVLDLQRDQAAITRDVAQIQTMLKIRKSAPVLGAQWVALKFAAGKVDCNAETVRLWALTGQIEAVKRGCRWFVNLPSVESRMVRGAASRAV
jgi:hypothetical protein